MLAAPILEKTAGVFQRPGFLVRPLGGQRVEDIGDRDDAPENRNVVAFQVARIARAIVFLVVGQGDLRPARRMSERLSLSSS